MGTKTIEHTLREKNRTVFNRWASSYDLSLFQYWMKKFHVPVIREVDFSTKPHILDISCGTGELLNSLVQVGEGDFYGVDLAEKMLEKARTKLPLTVRLQKADVHALPFENNTFDYTLTTEAFHHYYNQQKALQEMSRVTKKGGKIIIVDVNFFSPVIHFLFQKIEPGCVKINGKTEIRTFFEKAGLRIVKQQRIFAFAVMTVGVKS